MTNNLIKFIHYMAKYISTSFISAYSASFGMQFVSKNLRVPVLEMNIDEWHCV